MSKAERLTSVSKNFHMSLSWRCKQLDVCRRALYRMERQVPERDLALMRAMDRIHLAHPFYGSRQMVAVLRLEGVRTGRERVRRLMRLMGLVAVAPKPATSVKAPSHKVFK